VKPPVWRAILRQRGIAGRFSGPLRVVGLMLALAWADTGPAQSPEPLPDLPPPDFLRNKSPLPPLLLSEKRVGSYVTGFPAIGWDPETGFNYGAAVQWFDNGPADSPFFGYAPYRRRLAVGATGSTGGSTRAIAGYDLPYVGDTPWRVRSALLFDQNQFENYFGVGSSTLGPLTYPGSTKEYSNFDEYTDALNQKVNGQTWARYNQYRRTEGLGVVTVERDYLGGLLRPQLGFQCSYVKVHDYTGEDVDGAVMQETRLLSDAQAGKILGFEGGWDNAVKIGLTYDTRDFEPDPDHGLMFQAVGRVSSQALGSAFDYQQITFSARAYQNLLPGGQRLILAGRLVYEMQFGDVPFYSAPNIPFTDGDIVGLGGHATMRGFVTDRFVGKAAVLGNGELRWSFGQANLWGQNLRFMLVPFVDAGRVFDSAGETTLHDLKFDGGLGIRLGWNLSTVVSFDYGRSSEGGLFYMELGHQF